LDATQGRRIAPGWLGVRAGRKALCAFAPLREILWHFPNDVKVAEFSPFSTIAAAHKSRLQKWQSPGKGQNGNIRQKGLAHRVYQVPGRTTSHGIVIGRIPARLLRENGVLFDERYLA